MSEEHTHRSFKRFVEILIPRISNQSFDDKEAALAKEKLTFEAMKEKLNEVATIDGLRKGHHVLSNALGELEKGIAEPGLSRGQENLEFRHGLQPKKGRASGSGEVAKRVAELILDIFEISGSRHPTANMCTDCTRKDAQLLAQTIESVLSSGTPRTVIKLIQNEIAEQCPLNNEFWDPKFPLNPGETGPEAYRRHTLQSSLVLNLEESKRAVFKKCGVTGKWKSPRDVRASAIA